MNKDPIDENILRKLYIDDELAINKISDILNVSVGKVFKYIKLYNIQTRKTLTESQKNAISQKNKGNKYAKGKRLSEETKRKMAESHRIRGAGHKKKRKEKKRRIYCHILCDGTCLHYGTKIR